MIADRMIVAHGEPFTMTIKLADQTASRPGQAEVRAGGQPVVAAPLADGQYAFEMPPQIDPVWLDVRVGDYTKRIHLEPTLRPELSSVTADVALPSYLGRTQASKKDVRGGTLSLVKGSKASFSAMATRELARPGQQRPRRLSALLVTRKRWSAAMADEFGMQDHYQLAGKDPSSSRSTGTTMRPLARFRRPLQASRPRFETLTFTVRAQDDFGAWRVGIDWKERYIPPDPAKGERSSSAGPDRKCWNWRYVFSQTLGTSRNSSRHGSSPNYYPGCQLAHSPTYLLRLNAEQHAIWLTEQLSKWHRQSPTSASRLQFSGTTTA